METKDCCKLCWSFNRNCCARPECDCHKVGSDPHSKALEITSNNLSGNPAKWDLKAPESNFAKGMRIADEAGKKFHPETVDFKRRGKAEQDIEKAMSKAPTDESWDEKRDIYKMGFEVGKSEAFSLVRKMVHDSKDLRDPKTQIYKIINAHDFLTKLSALEGK